MELEDNGPSESVGYFLTVGQDGNYGDVIEERISGGWSFFIGGNYTHIEYVIGGMGKNTIKV